MLKARRLLLGIIHSYTETEMWRTRRNSIYVKSTCEEITCTVAKRRGGNDTHTEGCSSDVQRQRWYCDGIGIRKHNVCIIQRNVAVSKKIREMEKEERDGAFDLLYFPLKSCCCNHLARWKSRESGDCHNHGIREENVFQKNIFHRFINNKPL